MSARRGDPLRPDVRSTAREAAMIVLYQADNSGVDLEAALAAQPPNTDPLTTQLVRGVDAHREQIDAAISAHARGWSLARMPAIDRAVLRLASYELLDRAEVPTAVILDEAVELVKTYSTDDSGRFVNGVLAALVKVYRATAGRSE